LLKRILKNLGKVAIGTIVCLALLEGGIRVAYKIRNSRVEYVPIPYMVRHFGVVPPWMDGLRIIEPDERMVFRGRPNAQRKYLDLFCPMPSEQYRKAILSRFSPSIPAEFKNNPTWEVRLNSEGYRDAEFPTVKTPNTIRIVCLGDSWTFGHNADQDKTYPQRLAALLKKSYPNINIEVLNLGMLNYSSYEGLALLKSRALGLDPDIVLIGFAMNDSFISGWRDKDVFVEKPKRFSFKQFVLGHFELYKLLTYLAQVGKFESVSMSDDLKAAADPNAAFVYEAWVSAEALEAKDYERLESRVRVSPADYEKNIREMIRLVKARGSIPILLHNDLRPGSPYQSALQKISKEVSVPLVDSCELLAAAKRRIESELEQELGLQSSNQTHSAKAEREVEVVFRLYAADRQVPRAMYISGPLPQLGNTTPNKIAMYDDGTHGDQKAGDHVWSLSIKFLPGQKVFYVYTNSGEEGKWQNLDVPKVRSFVVAATGARVYRPIESFGKLYLQADGFHTNPQGLDLIAQAVRDAIVQTEKFKRLAR
jgi:lysophospholipase L1-like esterase